MNMLEILEQVLEECNEVAIPCEKYEQLVRDSVALEMVKTFICNEKYVSVETLKSLLGFKDEPEKKAEPCSF